MAGTVSRQADHGTELFTLTCGALVTQLHTDHDSDEDMNTQLGQMASRWHSTRGRCLGMAQRGEATRLSGNCRCYCQSGIQDVPGHPSKHHQWEPSWCPVLPHLESNPLVDSVELPENHVPHMYSNLVCGCCEEPWRWARWLRRPSLCRTP